LCFPTAPGLPALLKVWIAPTLISDLSRVQGRED
jgi:hypothetical protein